MQEDEDHEGNEEAHASGFCSGSGAAHGCGRVVHAAGELRVLNWQGYGTDEEWAVTIFEERTGFKVVHDNFNSEQEMLTKLRTSPAPTTWC